MIIDEHIAVLHRIFEPEATLPDSDAGVPDHWLDYLDEAAETRLNGLQHEMAKLQPYLPEVSQGLVRVTTEAFLIHSPQRGLCRILVRQIEGQSYYAYSRCPTRVCVTPEQPSFSLIKSHAPRAFSWIYQNLMDGLTDIYDFAGFVPSDRLALMSEEYPDLDYPWYNAFAGQHDTTKIVEFFSNGGGAYMLLNLNEDMRDTVNPRAMRVSSKYDDWTPENTVDFWPMLDAWMTTGLTES